MVPDVLSSPMGQLLHSFGSGPLIYGAVLAFGFVIKWGWNTLKGSSVRQMNAGARLFRAKRYAEAETHFRALLTRRLPAGVGADTRRRLADTLDILGKTEEAAQERDRASAVAMNSKRDPTALAAQGDLLKRQNRYDEACEMYEQALKLHPPVKSPGRALVMAKLATAHSRAGRSAETLKWARASLASGASNIVRHSMESMAGVASADLGELEQAETHYLRALELAEAGGKPEEISRGLAILGSIQYKRGQFEEAITTCRRSWQTNPEPSRTALLVEVECLRDMGRFEEARAVMSGYSHSSRYDQPWIERKHLAIGALTSAYIEIFAGRPSSAISYLEEAREGLEVIAHTTTWPPPPSGGEDKVTLWCDAALAYALADTGEAHQARQLMPGVESRLLRFGQDRATRLGTLSLLGRAAFALGDLAVSRDFWLQYLDCKPNPVSVPNAYYYLGELHLRLAETEAAREAFQAALAPGIDSFYARRAKARLAEIGG